MRYGLVVVIIAFLAIIGTVIFVSRRNNDQGGSQSARLTKLKDYEFKAANVSWTLQGRLVGEDQRRSVRITVSRDRRVAQVLSGYEERVEKSVELPNTPEAFATFLRALDNASFGRERAVKNADERGFCPQGNRYIYRLIDGGAEVMRSWSTSCFAAEGPFAGGGQTAQLIQSLFRDQVTDYNRFVSGVKL